jgi:hypothetical protein
MMVIEAEKKAAEEAEETFQLIGLWVVGACNILCNIGFLEIPDHWRMIPHGYKLWREQDADWKPSDSQIAQCLEILELSSPDLLFMLTKFRDDRSEFPHVTEEVTS